MAKQEGSATTAVQFAAGSNHSGLLLPATDASSPDIACKQHSRKLIESDVLAPAQDEVCNLKARFGHAMPQPKRLGTKANDMSQAGLQILQLELDNLHAERAQRERKLDMLLGRLRKACIELDEDDSAAAAAAHPSLQHHR